MFTGGNSHYMRFKVNNIHMVYAGAENNVFLFGQV